MNDIHEGGFNNLKTEHRVMLTLNLRNFLHVNAIKNGIWSEVRIRYCLWAELSMSIMQSIFFKDNLRELSIGLFMSIDVYSPGARICDVLSLTEPESLQDVTQVPAGRRG